MLRDEHYFLYAPELREIKIKRLITKRQEEAIRLCHPDFGGLSTKAAAKEMGIKQRAVQQLLQSAKKVAPQLFEQNGKYRRPMTVRYQSFMDSAVVRKF